MASNAACLPLDNKRRDVLLLVVCSCFATWPGRTAVFDDF